MEKQLRVCQILFTGLSGVGDVALNLIAGDTRSTCQHYLLFVGVDPLLDSYVEFCQRHNVEYEVVQTAPKVAELYILKVSRILSKIKADAVMVHGGTLGLFSGLIAKQNIVYVEHHAIALRNRRNWIATLVASKLCKFIVTLTIEYCRFIESNFNKSSSAEIVVIPNGVNTQEFNKRLEQNLCKSIKIGMAGRFFSSKRFDLLLDMLAELRLQRPMIEWTLSLAGDGPDRGMLEAKAKALGLQDSVDFTGMVAKQDLPAWFSSLDIYAHASDGETSSMALLQAMATGVPVIGSDVPGVNNALGGETRYGLLAKEQSGESFASAVLELVDEPNLAASLVNDAYASVIDGGNHIAMFDRYHNIFRRLKSSKQ